MLGGVMGWPLEAPVRKFWRPVIASGDVIRTVGWRAAAALDTPSITRPDALRLKIEPAADCGRYDGNKENRLMERHEILEVMSELKLYGMRASFDEVAGKGLARRDEIYPLIASLMQAERTHVRPARSVIASQEPSSGPQRSRQVRFADTPVDEGQVRELATAPSSTPNAMRSSSAAPEPVKPI